MKLRLFPNLSWISNGSCLIRFGGLRVGGCGQNERQLTFMAIKFCPTKNSHPLPRQPAQQTQLFFKEQQ